MKHCVYTNYERSVRNKDYYVFKYDREGVRATVGVRMHGYYVKIDQMYGIGNTHIDQVHKEYVQKWLDAEHEKNRLFKDATLSPF